MKERTRTNYERLHFVELTLWNYSSRFCVEELFLDSKSGAFGLEDSRLRHTDALKRLYLLASAVKIIS